MGGGAVPRAAGERRRKWRTAAVWAARGSARPFISADERRRVIWGSLAMKKWPGQGRQGRGAADDHPRHADRETAPRGKTGRRQGAGLGRTYGREGGFGPGRDAWPARWRLRCTDATRRRGARRREEDMEWRVIS